MKTMAEVVAAHVLNVADRSCSCDEMCYDTRPPVSNTRHEHSLHVEMELHNAGYGPVQAVAVVHVAHDTEAHARSFNEGYETAMAQELADDPTTAQDWLDAKLKAAGAQALRDAADSISAGGNISRWLRARAEFLATP